MLTLPAHDLPNSCYGRNWDVCLVPAVASKSHMTSGSAGYPVNELSRAPNDLHFVGEFS